jgi:integrase
VAIDDGRYVVRSELTLGDYLTERWLSSVKLAVEESTWITWSHYVRGNVLPYAVARRPIQLVSAEDLDRHYAELLAHGAKSGRGLAPKTVANIHGTLHAALQHAVDRGVVRTNPASRANKPSKRSPPRKVWEPDELQRFWAVAAHHRLFAAFVLAGTTGMRRGEVCGLAWDSIDFTAGSVAIVRALAQAGPWHYLKEPKTESGFRTVHVDDVTLDILREHKTRQDQERQYADTLWQTSGLVFTTELGEPLRPARLTYAFEQLRAKTGLPRITLHDLRHTFATLALADGANIKTLAEYLGQSEMVLLTRYAHVIRGANQALGKRMGTIISPRVDPATPSGSARRASSRAVARTPRRPESTL